MELKILKRLMDLVGGEKKEFFRPEDAIHKVLLLGSDGQESSKDSFYDFLLHYNGTYHRRAASDELPSILEVKHEGRRYEVNYHTDEAFVRLSDEMI